METKEQYKDCVPDSSCQKTMTLVNEVLEELKILEEARQSKKRGGQRKMPLWLFMLILLKVDSKNICIRWTNKKEYEFQVEKGNIVANVWGTLRRNKSMNYAKLTRALRYYYGKNLIEKVLDEPFTYRFVVSERTKHFLPKVTDHEVFNCVSLLATGVRIDERYQRPRSLPGSFIFFPHEHIMGMMRRREERRSFPSASYLRSNSADYDSVIDSESRASGSLHSDAPPCLNASVKNKELSYESLINDVDLSIEDANDDWENDVFFKRSTRPAAIPLTSCFTVADIPLLDFEDVKSLDDDVWSVSTSCSYASPRSSEPSIDMESSSNAEKLSPTTNENLNNNRKRSYSNEKDMETSQDVPSVTNLEKSVMDMEIEMELVQEYIDENSNI